MANVGTEDKRFDGTTVGIGVGFGLHVSWVTGMFFQDTIFSAFGNENAYVGFYIASMVVLSAALLIFALVANKLSDSSFFSKKSPYLFFAALSALGTLATGWSGVAGASLVFFVLGVLLTGIGSAFFNVVWGCHLVRHRSVKAIVALCIAYIVSVCVFFFISKMPPIAMMACTVLLPVLSSVGAFMLQNTAPEPLPEPLNVADNHVAVDMRHFAGQVLVSSFLFAMALGLVQGYVNSIDGGDIEHSVLYLLLMGLPLSFVIAYVNSQSLQTSAPERMAFVYRIAFLAMIGALLICTVLHAPNAIVHDAMLSGYTIFKIVGWSVLCTIARAGGMHPVRLIALGEATMTTALLLCNLLCAVLMPIVEPVADVVQVANALCIGIIIVAYLFFLTERRIVAIEEIGSVKNSAASIHEDGIEADDQPHFRFQSRIEDLSSQSGLTKREAEILRLFVRGRSSARIAEDLYISTGTGATHLRNIYKKINVHSRQELLDLLDNNVGAENQ